MSSVGICTLGLLVAFLGLLCNARHVPLNSQRGGGGQSRPRLLVIRPPPGSNQRKRVIVLSNPRFLQSDTASAPGDMARIDQSRASLPTSLPGLTTLQESPPPTDIPADNGHPQSLARKKDGPKPNTRSLRNLLEAMNNQRKSRQDTSNIARISDSVPRAAPPVMPTDNRFGDLNIPRVIEAALKRAQEKSRFMGNVRPMQHGHSHSHTDRGHMHGDLLDITDLSLHNSARAREFARLKASSDPAMTDSSSFRGSGLRSFGNDAINRSGRRRGNVEMHSHGHRGGHHQHTMPEVPKSKMTKITTQQSGPPASQTGTKSNVPIQQNTAPQSQPAAAPAPKAILSANVSSKIDSASTNSSSNTTSTKSVKTKTIKVTTVVKGGTAADVAAAAASQAEIAQAVSNGKDMNSSAIAEIAKAVVEKRIQSTPAPGSITVKRQNGVSVITLADGVGDPVVIRATGPVKIERIVKPDGKVQFVINPVLEPTTNVVTTARATSAEKEIEAEDITTTALPSTIAPTTPTAVKIDVTTNALPNTPALASVATGLNVDVTGNNLHGAAKIATPVQQVKVTDPVQVNTNQNAPTANKAQVDFSPFGAPRIPRPPPTIPRPPKISDMFLRDQRLLDQMTAAQILAGESGEMVALPMHRLQSSTAPNTNMPQYEVLQGFANTGDVIL